jgi:hypothetical protein
MHNIADSGARLQRWADDIEPPALDELAQRTRTRRRRRRLISATTCAALVCVAGLTVGLVQTSGGRSGTAQSATGPSTTIESTNPGSPSSASTASGGGAQAVVLVTGTVQGRTNECVKPIASFYRSVRKHGEYDRAILCTNITLGPRDSCVTVGVNLAYRHPNRDPYYDVIGTASPSHACR